MTTPTSFIAFLRRNLGRPADGARVTGPLAGMGYRYRFADHIDLREARTAFALATMATAGLLGWDRVHEGVAGALDESINVLVADASTLAGLTANLIFLAFITAEFGSEAFDVRQVELISGSAMDRLRAP